MAKKLLEAIKQKDTFILSKAFNSKIIKISDIFLLTEKTLPQQLQIYYHDKQITAQEVLELLKFQTNYEGIFINFVANNCDAAATQTVIALLKDLMNDPSVKAKDILDLLKLENPGQWIFINSVAHYQDATATQAVIALLEDLMNDSSIKAKDILDLLKHRHAGMAFANFVVNYQDAITIRAVINLLKTLMKDSSIKAKHILKLLKLDGFCGWSFIHSITNHRDATTIRAMIALLKNLISDASVAPQDILDFIKWNDRDKNNFLDFVIKYQDEYTIRSLEDYIEELCLHPSMANEKNFLELYANEMKNVMAQFKLYQYYKANGELALAKKYYEESKKNGNAYILYNEIKNLFSQTSVTFFPQIDLCNLKNRIIKAVTRYATNLNRLDLLNEMIYRAIIIKCISTSEAIQLLEIMLNAPFENIPPAHSTTRLLLAEKYLEAHKLAEQLLDRIPVDKSTLKKEDYLYMSELYLLAEKYLETPELAEQLLNQIPVDKSTLKKEDHLYVSELYLGIFKKPEKAEQHFLLAAQSKSEEDSCYQTILNKAIEESKLVTP